MSNLFSKRFIGAAGQVLKKVNVANKASEFHTSATLGAGGQNEDGCDGLRDKNFQNNINRILNQRKTAVGGVVTPETFKDKNFGHTVNGKDTFKFNKNTAGKEGRKDVKIMGSLLLAMAGITGAAMYDKKNNNPVNTPPTGGRSVR